MALHLALHAAVALHLLLACLALQEDPPLHLVYPAARALTATNEVEDGGWVRVKHEAAASAKPVTRTKSSSMVSTSYSVSSSVSSRRADTGAVRVREGRVGKLDRERMRDFYTRRRSGANRLLIIPPTR